jgi:hypothetical protein
MPETIIEQIKNDLFRAEVPLPRNPLKATNSYIMIRPQKGRFKPNHNTAANICA